MHVRRFAPLIALLLAITVASSEARGGAGQEFHTAYILDGKNSSFALYPGPGDPSAIAPADIHSMEELVKRVKKLPKGTRIYWTAAVSADSPALLFEPGMVPEFGKFCKKRGIEFIVSHIVALAPIDPR